MSSYTVIKIGGRAAADQLTMLELAREVKRLRDVLPSAAETGARRSTRDPSAAGSRPDQGSEPGRHRFVIVHGGGSELSTLMERYGFIPEFKDGLRQTSEAEMPLVDMALAGRMNSAVVRTFGRAGLNPVGLSAQDGETVVGRPIVMADGTGSRTGSVAAHSPRLLRTLLEAGFTPVLSPVSRDEKWEGLNINADEIALAIAETLEAEQLLFLSDIPGILAGEAVIDRIDRPTADRAIGDGTISGGMIPKVRSSLRALEGGVGRIMIGEYRGAGDLQALMEGKKGTVIAI